MRSLAAPLILVLPFLPALAQTTPKFPIGRDTTYVTGPLDKDGYIDYVAALNERMSKGVTLENNANVLLWKAYGPTAGEGRRIPAVFFQQLGMEEPLKDGEYFIEFVTFLKERQQLNEDQINAIYEQAGLATDRAWTETDFPHVVAWLNANERPLAIAVEASRRPKYYQPAVRLIDKNARSLLDALAVSNAGVRMLRHIVVALADRALLNVAKGQSEKAWEDLLACHRISRLLSQRPTLIDWLIGVALESITISADVAFLDRAQLPKDEIIKKGNEFRRMSPLSSLAETIDTGERFVFLDLLQHVHRYGLNVLIDPVAASIAKANAEESMVLKRIDWSAVLTHSNRWHDGMVKALRARQRLEREFALDKVDADLKEAKTELTPSAISAKTATLLDTLRREKNPQVSAKAVADALIGILEPHLRKVQDAADRVEQNQRNLYGAFALAAYHADHGRYPAKLDNLAPQYLAEIPNDLFSGKALLYRPSDRGYLLYSVGKNGKDDGGQSFGDEPPGDDLSVRMPLPPLRR